MKKFSYVGDQSGTGNVGVDTSGDSKFQKELGRIAPFMGVEAAGYQTAAEALEAYEEGKLKPSEVVDVTKSLGLVSEEECLDLTAKGGLALLKKASNDEGEYDSTINEAASNRVKKVKGRGKRPKTKSESKSKPKLSNRAQSKADKEVLEGVVTVDGRAGKNLNFNQTPQADEATTNEEEASITNTEKDQEENVQKKSKPRTYKPNRPRITNIEEDQELDSKIVETEQQLRKLRERRLAGEVLQVKEFEKLLKEIAKKDFTKANEIINNLRSVVAYIIADRTDIKQETSGNKTNENSDPK